MFSYIIPLIGLLLVFSNPILQLFQPDRPLATERPAINESQLAIPGEGDGVGCEGGYRVHVWSIEPLVVYVEGFLSEEERRNILEMRYVHLCQLLTRRRAPLASESETLYMPVIAFPSHVYSATATAVPFHPDSPRPSHSR